MVTGKKLSSQKSLPKNLSCDYTCKIKTFSDHQMYIKYIIRRPAKQLLKEVLQAIGVITDSKFYFCDEVKNYRNDNIGSKYLKSWLWFLNLLKLSKLELQQSIIYGRETNYNRNTQSKETFHIIECIINMCKCYLGHRDIFQGLHLLILQLMWRILKCISKHGKVIKKWYIRNYKKIFILKQPSSYSLKNCMIGQNGF